MNFPLFSDEINTQQTDFLGESCLRLRLTEKNAAHSLKKTLSFCIRFLCGTAPVGIAGNHTGECAVYPEIRLLRLRNSYSVFAAVLL